MLCERCFDVFALSGRYYFQNATSLDYASFTDIVTSAKNGCDLCSAIVKSAIATGRDDVCGIGLEYQIVSDQLDNDRDNRDRSQSGALVIVKYLGYDSNNWRFEYSRAEPLDVSDRARKGILLLTCRLEDAKGEFKSLLMRFSIFTIGISHGPWVKRIRLLTPPFETPKAS
jgi:hypothetical protein